MKTKILYFIAAGLLLFTGYGWLKQQQQTDRVFAPESTPRNRPLPVTEEETLLNKLTLKEKVGQLFIGGYYKTDELAEQARLIQEYDLSGVILMGVNVADPEKTQASLSLIKKVNDAQRLPLFISIDEEGGVITRLRDQLKEQTPQSQVADTDLAYRIAFNRGKELKQQGINLVYSPVLDWATPESFLYRRTFHTSKDKYPVLAQAMLKGFKDAGIMGVPKHFPGHPPASSDSHLGLPVSEVERADLPEYASQFKSLISEDPPQMLMTGHILFSHIDPEYPATLSQTFIQEILREEWGYQGVVITDDLSMDAISDRYSPEEAAVLALEAGNDIVLYVSTLENQKRVIEGMIQAVENGRISEERLDQSVGRVLKLKESL